MKKAFKVRIVGSLAILAVLVGCSDVIIDPVDTSLQHSGGDRKTGVSQRIGRLKDAGLLDSLISGSTGRSTLETGDNEQLLYFINNTDAALDEIAQSENGEVQLKLIDAMFSDATVGEIADIMAQISPEMSQEYLVMIEELVLPDGGNGQERSLISSINSRDIRLGFYDMSNRSRGLFDADFSQSTINWYYGLCAVTIAGLSAYKWVKWWQPWVGVAGLVTAAAGGASMAAKLAQWYGCGDFRSWVDALVSAYDNTGNFQSAAATANNRLV
ncbi:MAG: hypothetical protein LBL45_05085 [Treponema sp.]|jgi:hypothetical protein|nr:hypothetical protein [Treponema sp.]